MKPRLLMVDDEDELGRLLCRIAEDVGFIARHLSTARGFLAAIEAEEPDLVILDLGLPEVGGVELMRALAERGVHAEVLIMSGSDTRVSHSANRLGEARGLRMAGHVAKPIRVAELREMLAAVKEHFDRRSNGKPQPVAIAGVFEMVAVAGLEPATQGL